VQAVPRLAIIATQSVKCIGVRRRRGYDGAEKLVGRKAATVIDAEGHL
jgi:putative transposase